MRSVAKRRRRRSSTPATQPTGAELAILNVLWSLGPATVRDVHDELPDAIRRGYTTTLKLMQIMVEKGLLDRDESSRSHVYTAVASQESTQVQLLEDLADRAFGGSAARLALRALSDQYATADELAEIRALLDRLEGGE
jgi:predicted transcriptional regulator